MSAQTPNLGSIANDLQSISKNFSSLCLELSKLENLPSVELLTQIKILHDSIGAKEEIRKVADSVKAAEEKLDRRLDALFADVKAVQGSVELLQDRLSTVQAAQNTALATTDAHVSAVEYNCYARYKNSRNRGYDELVGFLSDDNKAVTNFPENPSELNILSSDVVDSIIKALKLDVTGNERERRNGLKSWIGRG